MPTKVSTTELLRAIAEAVQTTRPEVWVGYRDFKEILTRADIYSSDPSLRNAWTRITGTQYCLGTTCVGQSRRMLLAVRWLRRDLGIADEDATGVTTAATGTEAF